MSPCPLCEAIGEVVVDGLPIDNDAPAEWVGVKVPCYLCLGAGYMAKEDASKAMDSRDEYLDDQIRRLRESREGA